MSCSKVLKEKGYRLTPQRRLILDILHNENNHLTAEAIYEKIKKQITGVNISTVYRTLDLLEKLGLVFKSEYENGHIYHHVEEGQHHHLVCDICGHTLQCSHTLIQSLGQKIRKQYGFEAELHHLVIIGTCSKCSSGK